MSTHSARKKSIYVLLITIGVVILASWVLVGVANWAFPQGEAYFTGEYNEETGREIWENLPSPLSNPAWVRFFQDNEDYFIYGPIALAIFGSITAVFVGNWTESHRKCKTCGRRGKVGDSGLCRECELRQF